MGVMEAEFSQELLAHGLEVTQQLAVGSYNIDIAIDKHHIAIEIRAARGKVQLPPRLSVLNTSSIVGGGLSYVQSADTERYRYRSDNR